ncbi:hypothetical protein RQP46_006814 [Phenoliferia psychrophenolica]
MATMVFRFLPWFLRPSRLGGPRSLVLGITLGFSLSLSLTGLALYARDAWKQSIRRKAAKRVVEVRSGEIVDGVEGLIVIKEAEEEELIRPHTGSCIFEGTSGSTGISIAGIARSRGYKAHIVLPDDVAREKVQLLEALGAEVEKVRPVSIVDKRHYVNLARIRAAEFGDKTVAATTSIPIPTSSLDNASSTTPNTITSSPSEADLLVRSAAPVAPALSAPPSQLAQLFDDPPRGLFADQFENLSNLAAHEDGTAQEIWKQTSGILDAFVSGAGTGGTIAGVGRFLKSVKPDVKIVLADPQGSGLFHKVHDGVMYSSTEEEGKRRRHQMDTVVEGIGLNRLTKNFNQGLPLIDDAFRVTDAEAVAMSRHLAREDGLFLGSSSAVNLVASIRLAKTLEPGARIVTILCDSGTRHYSRFWNDEYLAAQGIEVSSSIQAILDEE